VKLGDDTKSLDFYHFSSERREEENIISLLKNVYVRTKTIAYNEVDINLKGEIKMDGLEFLTIEELVKLKSEYTMKALREYRDTKKVSKMTEQVLWYASRAIFEYEAFGNDTNTQKRIKEYYHCNGELELMLRKETDA